MTNTTTHEYDTPITPEKPSDKPYAELAKGLAQYAEVSSSQSIMPRVHEFFAGVEADVAEYGLKSSSGEVLGLDELHGQIALFMSEFRNRPEDSDVLDPSSYADALRAFPRAKGFRQAIATLLESPGANLITLQYLDVIAAQQAAKVAQNEAPDEKAQAEVQEVRDDFSLLSSQEQNAILAYKRSVMDKALAESEKNFALAGRLGKQVFEDRQRLSPQAKRYLGLPSLY